MLAIWRQLIWKEWREQVWKMVSVGAIVLAVEGYMFFSDPRGGVELVGVGLMAAIPGVFFIAIGVAAGERTAGSLDFLRSLPFERWKWAAVRLALGAVASLVPIVFTAAVMLLLAWALRSSTGAPGFLRDSGFSALCCLGVYAWTIAVGARQTNELRAGLAAICLFVGWFVLFITTALLASQSAMKTNSIAEWTWLVSPLGFVLFRDPAYPRAVYSFTEGQVVCAQLAALIAASWWFLRRYAAMTASDNCSPAATKTLASATLRPPRASPLAAMIWKEYREAMPMCLAGLAIATAILLPVLIGADETSRAQELRGMAGFIVALGAIMAVVLGVGGLAADLQAGVWQFWRSRPIPPAGWFSLKYLTGAVVLMAVFDGAPVVINLLAGGLNNLLRGEQFWFGPLFHLLAYSAAVWMVCQLRQPIYAGILALGLVMSLLVLGAYPVGRPLLPWLNVNQLNTCRQLDLGTSLSPLFAWLVSNYLPFAALMLSLAAAFALLGWRAVRRGGL